MFHTISSKEFLEDLKNKSIKDLNPNAFLPLASRTYNKKLYEILYLSEWKCPPIISIRKQDNGCKPNLKPKKEKEMFVKDSGNIFTRNITNIIQQDGYTIIFDSVIGKTIVKTYKEDHFDRELGLLTCFAKSISSDRSYRDLKKCFVNGRHTKKNTEINKALVKGYILTCVPLKEYNKLWEAFKEKYND